MAPEDPAHLLEVGAYWKHKITLTAVKLDIFTLLSQRSMTASELAARLQGSSRAFGIFLNALAALGLLLKEGVRFSNTAVAAERLVRDRKGYAGDQLVLDDSFWGLWGTLEETLLTSSGPLKRSLFHSDLEKTERLITGLHRDATRIAPRVVELVPLDDPRRLLDLGGGAGTYSIAFCERYPRLEATVFDLPNTTRVTRNVVKEHGMGDRISVVDGDFLDDPIEGVYDALLMSNVLHGQGEEENAAVFRKVHAATGPGGTVIVRDVVMRESLVTPRWGAVFAVNMLLHTGRGRCYSFQEICGWMEEAGFADIQELQRHELLVARRPVARNG